MQARLSKQFYVRIVIQNPGPDFPVAVLSPAS